MDLKEQEILGPDIDTHWYYVAKGRAMGALLGQTRVDEVLDVGAGSGIFARQLMQSGVCRQAVCVDPEYSREHTEIVAGQEIRFVRSIDNPGQELVLMMDVLEHVDDDVGLLRQYTEHLPGDGRVLISVPAFPSLWSGHDVFLEHRRRYTRDRLETVVHDADLRVERCLFFFGLLLPVVAGLRWLDGRGRSRGRHAAKSSLRRYPSPVNRALTVIHDLERLTLFPFNRLAGLTLFCVAGRK